MTTFVWRLKITQSTVAAACLAVAAIFASGYGLGLLSRRHADQAEILEANHQHALALQAVAQAHQEKATMMASLMQHFREGPQSLSETPSFGSQRTYRGQRG